MIRPRVKSPSSWERRQGDPAEMAGRVKVRETLAAVGAARGAYAGSDDAGLGPGLWVSAQRHDEPAQGHG